MKVVLIRLPGSIKINFLTRCDSIIIIICEHQLTKHPINDNLFSLVFQCHRPYDFTISEIILGINILIFLIAATMLGLPTALYSILTYYTASRMTSFVVEGLEEYTGVTIISGQSEAIKEKLVMQLGRGITVYKGERGFLKESFDTSHPVDIVFTVVTRLELRRSCFRHSF